MAKKERKILRLAGKEEHERALKTLTFPDRHPSAAKREDKKGTTNRQGNEQEVRRQTAPSISAVLPTLSNGFRFRFCSSKPLPLFP